MLKSKSIFQTKTPVNTFDMFQRISNTTVESEDTDISGKNLRMTDLSPAGNAHDNCTVANPGLLIEARGRRPRSVSPTADFERIIKESSDKVMDDYRKRVGSPDPGKDHVAAADEMVHEYDELESTLRNSRQKRNSSREDSVMTGDRAVEAALAVKSYSEQKNDAPEERSPISHEVIRAVRRSKRRSETTGDSRGRTTRNGREL